MWCCSAVIWTPILTAPDWVPGDGFTASGHGVRSDEEFETAVSEIWGDEKNHLDYLRRHRAENCPEPAPFATCDACRYARYIVAYQPVGLIAPPSTAAQAAQNQES